MRTSDVKSEKRRTNNSLPMCQGNDIGDKDNDSDSNNNNNSNHIETKPPKGRKENREHSNSEIVFALDKTNKQTTRCVNRSIFYKHWCSRWINSSILNGEAEIRVLLLLFIRSCDESTLFMPFYVLVKFIHYPVLDLIATENIPSLSYT